jgi:hypothetical protein
MGKFNARRYFPVMLMLFCTAALAGRANGENLVQNADFHDDSKGWTLFVAPGAENAQCKLEIVANGGHDGGACAKLSSQDFARFALGQKQQPAAAPGDRFRIRFWVKNQDAVVKPGTGGVIARMVLRGEKTDVEKSWSIFIGTNGKSSTQSPFDGIDLSVLDGGIPAQWTKIESVVEVPRYAPDTKKIDTVGIFGWETKGTFFIDGVSMEKVSADTPLGPTVEPKSKANKSTSKAAPHASGPIASDAEALAELNVDAPGMEDVKKAVASGDLAAVQSAYLQYRRTKCPAKFFVMPSDKPTKAVETDDVAGDEVARGFIRNMYGFVPLSGEMSNGKSLDWKRNPLPQSDPAFTNEWTWCVISRTQYWRTLADAYWKTLDEKYAKVWVDQLMDFIQKNPSDDRSAPSLWRTLDSSERMDDSWPYAYAHFVDLPIFTPRIQWIYLRSVLDHVKVLKEGLETPGRTGNWVASECYALYSVGVLFPELKDAPAWRDYATARMVKELDLTVPPDGLEAELTPSYHYFALSSYTGPVQLARLNGLTLPSKLHEKIVAMYRAPVIIMDQRGVDMATNDSGEVNAVDQARRGHDVWGSDPVLDWAISGKTKGTPLPTSTRLPYAGFYTMRGGWGPKDSFLFFRAGPTGLGHHHEDDLSIAMRGFGRSLLFTQGTYTYDQSTWRRFALGTSAYSTIIVDGNGQDRGDSKVPVLHPVPNPWVTTPLFDFVSGKYDGGYQASVYNPKGFPNRFVGSLDRSVTHTRRIVFLKPYYALVLDTVDGTGTHTYDSLYYMDAHHATLDEKTQAIFSDDPGNGHLAIYPLDRDGLKTTIVQGQKEPMLGWYASRHEAVPTAVFHKEQATPARFATFLYPFWADRPEFSAKNLSAGDGVWGEDIHSAMEDATIALALDNAAHAITLDNLHANAAGLVQRKAKSGEILTGGWKISSYSDQNLSFSSPTPVELSWEQKPDGLLVENESDAPCTLQLTMPFASTATLAPHQWTAISKTGATAAEAPSLFKPIQVTAAGKSYADYLKSQATSAAASGAQPIRIGSSQLILPPGVTLHAKKGVDHVVPAAWDAGGTEMAAEAAIPKAGWYRLKVRYCSADAPLRTLLINGVCPFAEASDYLFPSTMGKSPSDGWSNHTDDWRTLALGEPLTPGGWKLYLPAGKARIALRNESGGSNIDWFELDPVPPGR